MKSQVSHRSPLALNLAGASALALALASTLQAQHIAPADLAHPPTDSWPGYHGDYSGKRHSSLTQITPANVGRLGLAWAFQTNQGANIKSTPIVVDGILYFTVPRQHLGGRCPLRPSGLALHVSAEWRSAYWPPRRLDLQGLALLSDSDAHLVSLDAKNGKVRWIVRVADSSKGYWTTMAPLIVESKGQGNVLVGVSGDFDNLSGFLRSVDPETGRTLWQWDSTSPPGTPNKSTGGMTWMTGTYDPQLNLVYWGTGNPTPVLQGSTRPGDDLYTCSIVAIDPDTGKLVWAFQPSPHDTHDWDAVETQSSSTPTSRASRARC